MIKGQKTHYVLKQDNFFEFRGDTLRQTESMVYASGSPVEFISSVRMEHDGVIREFWKVNTIDQDGVYFLPHMLGKD